MEKIKILGKEYTPKIPDDTTTAKDFEEFMEVYNKHPDLKPDFFELLGEFSAYQFMKHNKDLFVKLMVEDYIRLFWQGVHNWFERNIPLSMETKG